VKTLALILGDVILIKVFLVIIRVKSPSESVYETSLISLSIASVDNSYEI
jgi:hypothetical protein